MFILGLLVIAAVVTALISKRVPRVIKIILIIAATVPLIWLDWLIGRALLTSSTGFAARNRPAEPLIAYLCYIAITVAIANVGIAFKNIEFSRALLGILYLCLPVLAFALF